MTSIFRYGAWFGGGSLLVGGFIAFYSYLSESGVLFDFISMYSKLSVYDRKVIFYAPVIAVSASYLAVLIKRAACMYFASGVRLKFSVKNLIELGFMLSTVIFSIYQVQSCIHLISDQRLQALTVMICSFIIGGAYFIQISNRTPFNNETVDVELNDWFADEQKTGYLSQKKYRLIVNSIARSYFIVVASFITATFMAF